MTVGRPLFAKLFLEGIEIPFTGATITNTVNQAAIAYVDLVPQEEINNIKPRTLVHLFVRDVNDPKGDYPYVLAFKGEVFGINFSKSPNSRSMSISCIDNTSYWDNVLTYFFNPMQSLGKGADGIVIEQQNQEAAIKGADGSRNVTHSTTNFYRRVMENAFAAAKKQGRVPELFDGLVAIVKEIGNVNDFYASAEERLRISDRITSASSGELSKLLKESEAMDWLMEVAGRHSGFATLRSCVNDLMSLVFHDFSSISFPAIVEQDSIKKSLTPGSKVPTTIGEFLFKPNMYMITPPVCNIFFPDEYSSFQFSRNFFSEPTRLIYKPELPGILGTQPLTLKQVFEPEAFKHFMIGKGAMPDSFKGEADTQVDTDYGHYNDADNLKGSPRQSSNGKKKEQVFLTNEEKLKGIIMAQEGMIPASSSFRQTVSTVGRRDYAEAVAKYLFYKKKFETRSIQITSHLKMSVVPGFTVLVLDDSSANQNIVAYCSSVTHRIYCNQGGYTNTTLSYARTATEQDLASGKAGEPLIPPWFKEDIFGKKVKKPTKSKDSKIDKKIQAAGPQVETPDALSTYYARLLGSKGSLSINQYTKEKTLQGAVAKILEEYRLNKKKSPEAVSNLIDKVTRRRYVGMTETFKFLGADPVGGDEITNFMEYYGKRLFGGERTFDSKQLIARRDVIFKYRDALKNNRGFRG
jgi:hypothetical protein